jgi:hypothetical protein
MSLNKFCKLFGNKNHIFIDDGDVRFICEKCSMIIIHLNNIYFINTPCIIKKPDGLFLNGIHVENLLANKDKYITCNEQIIKNILE